MTPDAQDTALTLDRQAAFRAFVQEQIREAVRATCITVLEEEVTQFIGAAR